MDLRRDFFPQGFRAGAAAAQREGDAAAKAREIDDRRRLPIDTIVIDVFRNAYDDGPRAGAQADTFAERFLRVTPILASHVLGNYGHARGADQVSPREIPASDQLRPERGKEAWGNGLDGSVRGDSVNWRLALDGDGIAVMVFQFERQSRGKPRRGDSGNSGEFVDNISLRLGYALGLGYQSIGNKQPDRLNLSGVSEARFHGAQREEAANQQPSSDQQHQSKRYLCDNQRILCMQLFRAWAGASRVSQSVADA